MGYSKSFYSPWLDLEGDDPGDTRLAELDNKNQQQPAANLTKVQPCDIGRLTSILANATPGHQTLILGEKLYPLVEQLEPNQAAKVTGILLEMDQTEVLHLLESPVALKSKVAEAMDVLRNVAHHQNPKTPTSQIAA